MTQSQLGLFDEEQAGPDITTAADHYQQARRRVLALTLCQSARNDAAWLLADEAARNWNCVGCVALGVPNPDGSMVTPHAARRKFGRN